MVINWACQGHNLYIYAFAPTSKKLKEQIGLGLLVCPSIYPSPPLPPIPPPKKNYFF